MKVILFACFSVLLIQGGVSVIHGEAVCDGEITVYADGKLIVRNNTKLTVNEFSIDNDTQVIGVSCDAVSYGFGIILALDNGIHTDTSWKCSGKYDVNWNVPSFDDSDWNDAVLVLDRHNGAITLNNTADWIWKRNPGPNAAIAFCRKLLVKDNLDCQKCYSTSSHSLTGDGVMSTYPSTVTITEFITLMHFSTSQVDSSFGETLFTGNELSASSAQPIDTEDDQGCTCSKSKQRSSGQDDPPGYQYPELDLGASPLDSSFGDTLFTGYGFSGSSTQPVNTEIDESNLSSKSKPDSSEQTDSTGGQYTELESGAAPLDSFEDTEEDFRSSSTVVTYSSTQSSEFQSTQPDDCLQSSPTPVVVINKDGKTQLMSRACRNVIVVTDNAAAASEAKSSIVKELTVSKENLTAVVSKKISSEDSRTSAQAVGYVGIVFFIIPVMIIILSDASYLIQLYQKINKGEESTE